MPHNKSIQIWQIMDVMIIMLVSSRSIMTMQSKTRRKNSYWDTVTLTAADLRWAWPFYIWSSWSFTYDHHDLFTYDHHDLFTCDHHDLLHIWSSWSFWFCFTVFIMIIICLIWSYHIWRWLSMSLWSSCWWDIISLIITLKEQNFLS